MTYYMKDTNNNNPILEIISDRLHIRTPHLEDLDQLYESIRVSSSDIYPWLPWATQDLTLDNCKNYIKHFIQCHNDATPDNLSFHIWNNINNKFIGSVYFGKIEWKIPTFCIGYWLDSREVKNGYAIEAVNALTHVAFQYFNAIRVEINTSAENLSAKKIPEQLNFDLEGELKNHHINYTTKAISSTLIYSCINIDKLPKSKLTWSTLYE